MEIVLPNSLDKVSSILNVASSMALTYYTV